METPLRDSTNIQNENLSTSKTCRRKISNLKRRLITAKLEIKEAQISRDEAIFRATGAEEQLTHQRKRGKKRVLACFLLFAEAAARRSRMHKLQTAFNWLIRFSNVEEDANLAVQGKISVTAQMPEVPSLTPGLPSPTDFSSPSLQNLSCDQQKNSLRRRGFSRRLLWSNRLSSHKKRRGSLKLAMHLTPDEKVPLDQHSPLVVVTSTYQSYPETPSEMSCDMTEQREQICTSPHLPVTPHLPMTGLKFSSHETPLSRCEVSQEDGEQTLASDGLSEFDALSPLSVDTPLSHSSSQDSPPEMVKAIMRLQRVVNSCADEATQAETDAEHTTTADLVPGTPSPIKQPVKVVYQTTAALLPKPPRRSYHCLLIASVLALGTTVPVVLLAVLAAVDDSPGHFVH